MTPNNDFAQFEPLPQEDKKFGPVPVHLDALQCKKLRMSLKIGIFYFQYTLLKQFLLTEEQSALKAPRGYAGHKKNEPVED